jgi:hypothetical protein
MTAGEIEYARQSYCKTHADHGGVPLWLAHLRDTVFEELPAEKKSWWLAELTRSMPADIDLKAAYHLINLRILERRLPFVKKDPSIYREQAVEILNAEIAYHKQPTDITRYEAESKKRDVLHVVSMEAARSAPKSPDLTVRSSASRSAKKAVLSLTSCVQEPSDYEIIADDALDVLRNMSPEKQHKGR